jgi:hypothetical protein
MNFGMKKIYALIIISILFILFVLTDGTIENNKTVYVLSFILFSIGAIYEVYNRHQKKRK